MAASSKAEYLKKYLSENAEEKKKKKRRKVQGVPAKVIKSRIVDDDIDLKSLLPENLEDTVEDYVGDNDPTVVEVIDERPEHVKRLEKYRKSGAWKVMNNEDKNNSSQEENNSDSDHSPRRMRHDSDSDHLPIRRGRHDSDSDQSPIRRGRHNSNSDQSPVRRGRHDSDSDQSPVRRGRHDSDSDQSPVRRGRHDSDSDQSPPRKQNNLKESKDRHTQFNKSKTRTKSRFSNIDSDESPPRRRRNNSDSDQSPPRRWARNSDSDQSPPRRRVQNSDSDQSPPRKKTVRDKSNIQDKRQKDEKTLSGKRAGLSSAKDMRREAEELRKKENEKFNQISDERLGKGAATVFRDKSSGRKRNLAEEKRKETEESKKKAKEDEKFNAWGKGLKQIEQQSQVVQEALHEANKPLARSRDDDDLDKMLREMDRAEDPMLAFMKKKKKSTGPPVKEKPRYKGPAPPPNRFDILPGYRWDGVNRSNGFEKQIFTKQAEKKATASQAYKWSVEDM